MGAPHRYMQMNYLPKGDSLGESCSNSIALTPIEMCQPTQDRLRFLPPAP